MSTATASPRIYVACLASYNAGTLHGVWIDLDGKDADEVHEEIQAMLKASGEPGAEEFAIHDHEGFEGIKIGEYTSIADVIAAAEGIEAHGGAFVAALDVYGGSPDYAWALSLCENGYGEYKSEEDYGYHLVDEGMFGNVEGMGTLGNYIDYASLGHDCLSDEEYHAEHNGTIYVFNGR